MIPNSVADRLPRGIGQVYDHRQHLARYIWLRRRNRPRHEAAIPHHPALRRRSLTLGTPPAIGSLRSTSVGEITECSWRIALVRSVAPTEHTSEFWELLTQAKKASCSGRGRPTRFARCRKTDTGLSAVGRWAELDHPPIECFRRGGLVRLRRRPCFPSVSRLPLSVGMEA
jgi:hypothetical protein